MDTTQEARYSLWDDNGSFPQHTKQFLGASLLIKSNYGKMQEENRRETWL